MAANWGTPIPGGFFDEEKHLYRNERGTVVPSSTQIFTILGLSDFSNIDPATLSWKRDYGDAVHAATEYLVHGDLDWDTLDEAIIAPVSGINERLKQMKFQVAATEERRVVTVYGMQFGMTLDLRGTIEHRGVRRNAVIDEKTGSKFERYWMWQLGSYLIPQEKCSSGWVGVILQVDPNGKVTPHYVEDVEQAKREFQTLLAAAILKLNAGYAKIANMG